MDTSDRFCIIGAGPCGLVAAKVFLEHGLELDVFERESGPGGQWNYGSGSSSVYDSAHMISSKRMTQFSDFPMPKHFPPYPSHRQALDYLRSYAEQFNLEERIRFGAAVERVEPVDSGSSSKWRVTFAGGESSIYRGVVIAAGHHTFPRWPELPGTFSGRVIHSRDYKTPDVLRGQRVLVIGGGNSGCDIAVEASQHASKTLLSLRRGYHFLPKFLLGGPLDSGGERFERWHLPQFVRRAITQFLVYVAHGRPERYGLPQPMHGLFETHPIVNSQLLYWVGHGRIDVRPSVTAIEGDTVSFADGRSDDVDLIICATGYEARLPMLDDSLVFEADRRPKLFLNCFHPHFDHLFVPGLIQPNGAIWPLAELQAQLMAAFLRAEAKAPQHAAWFREERRKSKPNLSGGIPYDTSERHRLEVEFHAYRRVLRRLIKRVGTGLPTSSLQAQRQQRSAHEERNRTETLPTAPASTTLP
jgi:hypothetical protein